MQWLILQTRKQTVEKRYKEYDINARRSKRIPVLEIVDLKLQRKELIK